MINKISLGTTAKIVAVKKDGQWSSVLFENISANNVYIVDTDAKGTADGIKIPPNVSYSDRYNDRDLYLIADASPSDVRVDVEYWLKGT